MIVDAPTSMHCDVMVAAARAGKHIFTEKVLAPTLAEANEIIAAADQASVVLTVSLPRLAEGYTQAITSLITDGACGDLTASSRDIFGCSKNRQNRIVENSTYPLDDFGFR